MHRKLPGNPILLVAVGMALLLGAVNGAGAFPAYGDVINTSDGVSTTVDDDIALAEYDPDLWFHHADMLWYAADPQAAEYTITTPEQLAGLAVLVTKYGVTFQGQMVNLGADIDLAGHQWFPIGCNEQTYWGLSPFEGGFNGRGHAIFNLHIENGYHGQALFGYARDAAIGNFTLYGDVTTGWQAAGVVAEMERTTLSHITNYANVATLFKSGDGGYASTAGGIVAYVADVYVSRTGAQPSRLENLVNYGSVEIAGITEQGGGVGGIVGSLLIADDDQTIMVSQCENHGKVYANSSNYNDMYIKGAGGIVGSTATYGNYQVTDCSNSGDVGSANLASTGGVVGAISGLNSSVSYCYNSGSVDGASPEEVAAAGGIVGRSVSAHTGNTELDITSCYNVGDVTSRGTNVSAILGVTSGFAEDWIGNDNAGGTTVHNDSNYYLEGSVKHSSQTGVLFQNGTIESGQPVSIDKMNSEEVIRNLNSTDRANDHYVQGESTPRLELRGASDVGIDSTSTQGQGADDAFLNPDGGAAQKETHMYAIAMDPMSDKASQAALPDFAFLLVPLCVLAFLAIGAVLQGADYRRQTRPLRAVDQEQG